VSRPRNQILIRPGLLVTAGGLGLLLCSCGSGRAAVYPVHGQVLVDGKPAAGAQVIFHPTGDAVEGRVKAVGQVDEEGVFSLTSHSAGDGAAPGEYVITLQWPSPRKQPFEKAGPDRLNGRYNNATTSQFRFTVEAREDNEVPVIRVH
jgi:hypothetical protein